MMISLYDRVEKIVGKGENAGYQHFLLFPQCFQKASFPEASKGVIVWEWVNRLTSALMPYKCKIVVFGKESKQKSINSYQTSKLYTIQIKTICRQHNKI